MADKQNEQYSPYCSYCGTEFPDKDGEDFKYMRTVANGELYECPVCREEIFID